jgi:hypothetical protein
LAGALTLAAAAGLEVREGGFEFTFRELAVTVGIETGEHPRGDLFGIESTPVSGITAGTILSQGEGGTAEEEEGGEEIGLFHDLVGCFEVCLVLRAPR